MVNQVWGKHATVVTGSQDGSKQISKNEWNENLNRKGLLGFDSETIASASDVTIPDDSSDDVSSFIKLSGSTNVNKFINTNTSDGDLLFVITTGSVTLVNVSSPSVAGQIRLLGNANKDLSTTVPTILMRVGNFWYEYGGVVTFDAGNLSGTTLASGVVTTSATTVGTIGSGTWQGTAVADSYVASASTWNGKQDALTFGISNTNVTKAGSGIVDDDFLRIDGTTMEGRSASEVLSDIGAQASLTFGISNGNVTKCNATVADNDFIRIDGTEQEGRSASEVLSDIGASAVAGSSSIVTVGTVTSGTWNGTAIADDYGGTGQSTYATGDVLYASGANTLAKLTAGSNTEVLTLAGGVPTWAAPAGGGAWSELANVSATGADELDSGTITAKNWLNVQVYVKNTSGSGNQNWQLNFNTDQWDDGNSKYATQEFTSYSFGVAGRTAQPTFYWGVGYTRADEFYAQTWITNRTGVVSLCQPMQCIIGYGDATTAPFLQQMYGLWNDTNQITKVTASINPSYGAGNWYMRVLGSD